MFLLFLTDLNLSNVCRPTALHGHGSILFVSEYSQHRSTCSYISPQTVNNWLYHAARAPTYNAFIAIMDKEVLPFKPLAYAAMMAHPRERWTHHAGPEDTVIADQTTSNPVEQNMNMVGPEVCVVFGLEAVRLPGTSAGCFRCGQRKVAVEVAHTTHKSCC